MEGALCRRQGLPIRQGWALQLLEQVEHVGHVGVLLPRGPPQVHPVEAGVRGCELQGAIKLIQQEPGRVRIYLHQVLEDAVEKDGE